MSTAGVELDESHIPVAVMYPSQSTAAKMLAISEAQLSRSRFPAHRAGGRGKHYAPRVILEAAAEYRRRSLNEVAGELVSWASKEAPEHASGVRAEVEEFFANRTLSIDREKFLEEARRTLPTRLYAQVKRAYERGSEDFDLDFASEERERAGAA